uniref:Uncharacterized protein n=1 Tax=Arundo donax TaxID=35708 RepID=A0A0A9GT36_ARUDO
MPGRGRAAQRGRTRRPSASWSGGARLPPRPPLRRPRHCIAAARGSPAAGPA